MNDFKKGLTIGIVLMGSVFLFMAQSKKDTETQIGRYVFNEHGMYDSTTGKTYKMRRIEDNSSAKDRQYNWVVKTYGVGE